MSTFTVKDSQFFYDGAPITIISGAIHYFRVVPEYWHDRLVKLKACGFNTVETYIPWNFHEIKPNEFDFSGWKDIAQFIRIAKDVGLFVIVRPSPYICAEWEFGGLPSWLLQDPRMKLRCSYQPFLDRIDAYYDKLMPNLIPLLCTNGGPIIAMQVENEYGSYGNDTAYLEYVKNSMIKRGVDVLLFTSDGAEDALLQGGMIQNTLATANFGSNPKSSFSKLKEYQSNQPVMCMEFWNGWFDHWGEEHHVRDAQEVGQVLDEILMEKGSVNFYMFHGGTNFGFYNGANFSESYEPTITSYDSDAPLNEAGEPTDKFYAIREVLEKHFDLPPLELPELNNKRNFGSIELTEQAALFDLLDVISNSYISVTPDPMEYFDQSYGFILYKTFVNGPINNALLTIDGVHDRAIIYQDHEQIAIIERWNPKEIPISIKEHGTELTILVENMGRVNYGPHLKDYKGITQGVRIGNQFLCNWKIHTLPLDNITEVCFKKRDTIKKGPMFYKAEFSINEIADTFLQLSNWTKGVVFINGFNLGRYWEKGPQKTLYIPAPLLKEHNEIIIFELEKVSKPTVLFRDTPLLE
ncbi:beta-galactosidase family protein [Gracilibacillus marinus]|uniref:Beta-galactosidase family protein n=1 Tax=Gracilibacillus marinus TaxID=630535 RepID=A0ABV8VRR8_9BACI